MTNKKTNKPFYRIDRLDFDGNKLLVEGFFVVENQSAEIFVKDEKGGFDPISAFTDPKNTVGRAFKYKRTIGSKKALIDFRFSVNGKMFPFARCEQGDRSPFNEMASSYYYKKGYVATMMGTTIKAQRIGWLRHLAYQEKYMRALKKKGKTDSVAKQSYRLRRIYNALSLFYSPERLCVVSDRYLTAGHQGIDLFYRIKEGNKGEKVYFAVDESKRKELQLPSKNILIVGSEKYKRILLLAQTMVYSIFDSQETIFIEPTYIKDILAKKNYSLI